MRQTCLIYHGASVTERQKTSRRREVQKESDMTYPYTLRSRIDASIYDVKQGMAVLVKVQPEELEEARRLVGDYPVIVATHEQAMAFITGWMAPLFKRKRRP
jgi:hypothetical protein